MLRICYSFAIACVFAAPLSAQIDAIEREPINYKSAQAENVITRGVDAIVIQPVDFNVAGTIAKMATRAGIPVASYDDVIMNAKHAAFVGRDPKEGGIAAATAVVASVPRGNYALIGGDPGQTGSTKMQEGYRQVLAPLVKKGEAKVSRPLRR